MRMITTLKLKNGNNISVVADVSSANEAKQLAVNNSSRLLRDEDMIVTKQSMIVSSEEWGRERNTQAQSNPKLYYVAFYMNGITQFVSINASSVKQAYNTVKNNYGIQKNIFMFIYEVHQSHKRKSAVNESKEAIKNSSYMKDLLKRTLDKSSKIDYIRYKEDIKCIVSLLNDVLAGNYKYMDKGAFLATVAILIFFNNQYDYNLDLNEVTTTMTDKQSLVYLINNIGNEVKKYEKFEQMNNKIVKV